MKITRAGEIDEIGILPYGEKTVVPLVGSLSQSEVLAVRGWAIDVERQNVASGVVATLGSARIELEYGDPRPDIAQALGSNAFLYSGFRGSIAASATDLGALLLRLFAIGHDGRGVLPLGEARIVNVVRGLIAVPLPANTGGSFALYHIDRKHRHFIERGATLEIDGWAYDHLSGGPIRGVYLMVDESHLVHGATGLSRPDVAAHLRDDARSTSGFMIRLDTTGIPAGAHRLRLGFINADGSSHESSELERLMVR